MPRVQLPATTPKRRAWNKGRIIGQKRPLLPKQVWAIRARLELANNRRDLTLFNVAIDSKLCGCDLVRLAVSELIKDDRVREQVSVIQSNTKTTRSIRTYGKHTRNCPKLDQSAGDVFLPFHVPEPLPRSLSQFDASIRSNCPRLGDGNRVRAERVRHAFFALDESCGNLPQDRQPPRRPTAAGSHQSG